jgi:hypothetical protein
MKVKVIYISGSGRTGSTLFGDILNQIDGNIFIGEYLRSLFYSEKRKDSSAIDMKNIVCGCGENLIKCSFWNKNNLLGFDLSRYHKIIRLRSKKNKHLEKELVKKLEDQVLNIYEGLSNKTVLIDSSKNPNIAKYLAKSESIDLHIIHMYRSPSEVVKSWSTPKEYLKKHPKLETYLVWITENFLSRRLNRRDYKYILVDFNEFKREPEQTIKKVLHFIGVDYNPNLFSNDHIINVSKNSHSVAGNPGKLKLTDSLNNFISIENKDDVNRNLIDRILIYLFCK